MAQETKTLGDLAAVKGAAPAGRAAPEHVQKLDKLGRAYATGKRKNAVARVWIKPGKGVIIVNDKDFTSVLRPPRAADAAAAAAQSRPTERRSTTSWRRSLGGGFSGQAGAVRHGISKALTYFEPDLRGVLKKGGFLTRDSRVVERKKYGRMKARRSFQFSKR